MNIIVAPHPDDELIGCFEIIDQFETDVYVCHSDKDITDERSKEIKDLKLIFPLVHTHRFSGSFIDEIGSFAYPLNNTYYFPDPIYETHPDHREYGAQGEYLLRKGYNVIFYSINMSAPYIHKVKKCSRKESMLNAIYPSQSDLWKYEKKYIMFEGRVKWLI